MGMATETTKGGKSETQEGLRFPAGTVGALIPVLVFILGKVAGHLWERPHRK